MPASMPAPALPISACSDAGFSVVLESVRLRQVNACPEASVLRTIQQRQLDAVISGRWRDVTSRSPISSHHWRHVVSMKRTFAIVLAAVAAAALFGGLVHAVLVVANVSEPAATTVFRATPRRLWAATVAVLALVRRGHRWAGPGPPRQLFRHRLRANSEPSWPWWRG